MARNGSLAPRTIHVAGDQRFSPCVGPFTFLNYRDPIWSDIHTYIYIYNISPPARWGLLDFIRVVLLLFLLPPPPRPPPLLPPLPPLPRPLLPCQLLAKLFANFGAQCALLDLNLGPSQLSAHRWTSTWDLPSSVRTAGPQPGTCQAQCAPLDLNLGPSELSAHRWTSKAR